MPARRSRHAKKKPDEEIHAPPTKKPDEEIYADRKQVIEGFKNTEPYLKTSRTTRPPTPDPHDPELASKRNWERVFCVWKNSIRLLAASCTEE
jgi:hypothetical protein